MKPYFGLDPNGPMPEWANYLAPHQRERAMREYTERKMKLDYPQAKYLLENRWTPTADTKSADVNDIFESCLFLLAEEMTAQQRYKYQELYCELLLRCFDTPRFQQLCFHYTARLVRWMRDYSKDLPGLGFKGAST